MKKVSSETRLRQKMYATQPRKGEGMNAQSSKSRLPHLVGGGLPRSKRWIVFLAALIVAGACVALAAAAVIQSQVVAEGTNLRYRFEKRVADAGGFDSGWHIHPGISFIQVQDGTLQVYDATCRTTTVTAGGTAVEAPWEPIRVVSTGRLTWTTTLLVEPGSPLSVPLSAYTPQRPNPCPSIP